jgi:hypothetical protein
MGLCATQKLVIPVNADDFSKVAVRAMLDMMHGLYVDEDDPVVADFIHTNFAFKIRELQKSASTKDKISLPKIHAVINNKTKVYKQDANVSVSLLLTICLI